MSHSWCIISQNSLLSYTNTVYICVPISAAEAIQIKAAFARPFLLWTAHHLLLLVISSKIALHYWAKMPGVFWSEAQNWGTPKYICTIFIHHLSKKKKPKKCSTCHKYGNSYLEDLQQQHVSVSIRTPSLLFSTHDMSSLWFISLCAPSVWLWPCKRHLTFQSNHSSSSRHVRLPYRVKNTTCQAAVIRADHSKSGWVVISKVSKTVISQEQEHIFVLSTAIQAIRLAQRIN